MRVWIVGLPLGAHPHRRQKMITFFLAHRDADDNLRAVMIGFDLSVYYPIPLLTAEGYVSLTHTMLDVAPKAPPPHVQYAAQLLTKVVSEVEIGLVTRIDEDFSTRIERAYDIFVDGVWFELRDRLAFFSCYNHEGTAKLTDEDREELDFDERLEQARSASKLHDRLFADGADFLRQSFPQQAALMAARLNWLESKQLEDQLAELVTPQFITLMKICQRRYEAMVKERSSRDGKSLADMQVLRHKLRVQLYAYAGAIGSLYDG
ncbi:MAG TPA: hypothetical protein VM869_33820, partial [Enhygromyxa sp.]|nr:hypothetical protein [Enhygromyxa sp.]